MARQNINIGTSANDKTGDPLRTSFTKTNANFTELYANVATLTTNVATLTNDISTIDYADILNAPADLSEFTDTTNLISTSTILTSANDIIITSNNHEWNFKSDGTVEHPGGVTQNYQNSTLCQPNAETVIYTSSASWRQALKLFVIAEGSQGSFWETQACDIIAVKGYVNDVVHVTAYGVTYSGDSPLATFDGRWNSTTGRIEVTCIPTSPTDNVTTRVHAIELSSSD